MITNATDLKNNLGKYLENAIREPVIVLKSGRESAVLISIELFEKLSEYEDLFWLNQARIAKEEGFLGVRKTTKRLHEMAKRAGIDTEDDE